MKIGICTCYDNHNYGSMLQAYATYVKFVELGYDCEFLCYRKKLNMIQKIKWLPRLLNKYLMKEKFRLIEKKIQLKKHPDRTCCPKCWHMPSALLSASIEHFTLCIFIGFFSTK